MGFALRPSPCGRPIGMLPRCVVLDGATLTSHRSGGSERPDDPSWAELSQLTELTVYPRTRPDEFLARAADVPLLLTNKVPIPVDTLPKLPQLRYVGVMATGVDSVDVAALSQRNILVTNVPSYSTESVVQHVFALILQSASLLSEHTRAVRQKAWSNGPDFCLRAGTSHELCGRTLGILGLGRIGRRVAEVGRALGMRPVACTRTPPSRERFSGELVSLSELFAGSDVLSLHCPLTPETRQVVNAPRLATMRPGSILVNTARGGLIDETALARALDSGPLGAAALDVLSKEPPPADHPLLSLPNCLVTPHVAWATLEARLRLMQVIVGNVRAYLHGAPCNLVGAPKVSAC